LDPLFQYFGKKLAKWGLDKRHAEILNMISNFRECCHDIVKERLKESRNKFDNSKIFRKSLIDLLYEQNKNSDDGLNDWEITDEFITFFFGGMDTTGHLLGMASYFLLKNP
jgi:cytochrome P450